jgi:hypothetical protein
VQLATLLQKSETVPDLHLCLLGLQSCVLAAYLALAALPLLATQHAHLAAALHRQMKGLPPPRFKDELLCLYGSKKIVKLPFPQIGTRDCLGFARQINNELAIGTTERSDKATRYRLNQAILNHVHAHSLCDIYIMRKEGATAIAKELNRCSQDCAKIEPPIATLAS